MLDLNIITNPNNINTKTVFIVPGRWVIGFTGSTSIPRGSIVKEYGTFPF